MADKFEITYSVDDGYVGKDRPQHFKIDAHWIEDDMSDDALKQCVIEMIEDDFEQRISWTARNLDDAVSWAKAIRDKKAEIG